MSIEVRPLTSNIGADVFGADLSKPADVEDIKRALADYGVIAIRGLDLSPDDHLDFARKWGPINVNRFFQPVDGYPEIAAVLKEPDQKSAIGETWHTDHSYDLAPAMCSMLCRSHCLGSKVPSVWIGPKRGVICPHGITSK